ncbi:hypothetical protein K431DRAFT_289325 [Polychaeton citri CBS 116435]|uniref:Uncharacterized protein n=1 Tax=Polychaeton citri CBS 116435 TaxID=1314669 RepID=A0A9P4PZ86_9PEZI|nr:hypothetical protein K431DRAFT_289325 [Polychaeton citri CBS 116435]
MPHTGSPPSSEVEASCTVSPLSNIHHGSRPPFSRTFSLDGLHSRTLRIPRPPRSKSTSTLPAMTCPLVHVPASHPERNDMPQETPTLSSPHHTPSEAGKLGLEQPLGPALGLPMTTRSAPSLIELTQALNHQVSQRQKALAAQHRLHLVHVVSTRAARLRWKAPSILHTLAECIRYEDKQSFAILFNALHDALDSNLENLVDSNHDFLPVTQAQSGNLESFLDQISPHARDAVVQFCVRLHSDQDYVANCLVNLSHKDLLALLPDRSTTKGHETVFGIPALSSLGASKPAGFIVDKQIDHLSTEALNSPLETLVALTSSDHVRHGALGHSVTTTWATACARLVVNQRPGLEKFIPAVFDQWAVHSPWRGKERLEAWLVQLLQKGNFLLEQPAKQSFSMRINARRNGSVEDHARVEAFYDDAVHSFFDLVASTDGNSVIPDSVLQLSHAICRALDGYPNHAAAFPSFVATRWLFSTFFFSALTQPECFDMLTDRFLLDVARQKILREVANRCHKVAFDVAYQWKYRNPLNPETSWRVQRALTCLRGEQEQTRDSTLTAYPLVSNKSAQAGSRSLVLYSHDVLIAIDGLYPNHRPASSDRDTLRSGIHSSTSSLSGFSLFQSANSMPDAQSRRDLQSTLDTSYAKGSDEATSQSYPGSPSDEDRKQSANGIGDVQGLREAFVEIQEFYLSHQPSINEQWVVLLPCDEANRYQTIKERAESFAAAARQPQAIPSSHIGYYTGKADRISPSATAIETLLRHVTRVEMDSLTDFRLAEYAQLDWETSIPALFDLSIKDAEEAYNFSAAYHWTERKTEYSEAVLKVQGETSLQQTLADIYSRATTSGQCSSTVLDSLAAQIERLHSALAREKVTISPLKAASNRLRNKMWYMTDVRTSAAFDEARSIATALRIMGKSQFLDQQLSGQPSRLKPSPKSFGTSAHLKTEAQLLELMGALPQHGGPNKLSDDQSRLTLQWMERNGIENFCKGEERLHKFCMVVRRCVDQVVGGRPSENTLLWPSLLFARDKQLYVCEGTEVQTGVQSSMPLFHGSATRLARYRTGNERAVDLASKPSQTLSASSSRELFENRSPTLTTRSSGTLWSPPATENAPSSATSIASYHAASGTETIARTPQPQRMSPDAHTFIGLREMILSLLLSDIGQGMFDTGCETDKALLQGLGGQLFWKSLPRERNSSASPVTVTEGQDARSSFSNFDFEHAFSVILGRFSSSINPHTKLQMLLDIQNLIGPYLTKKSRSGLVQGNDDGPKQTQVLRSQLHRGSSDQNVDGFRKIFNNDQLRPLSIFRDFQYIAALVPANVLENTAKGRAFWNAGIALSSMKREALRLMIETADGIIAYQTNNRGHGRSPSVQQQQRDSATFAVPSRTPSAEDIAHYTMSDAAHLLQITAKEGDPAAQRELATLYLTHPELMDHIIAPFTRPKDVFKDELQSKWRKNQDPNRCDPATMCVAHHWMSLSSRGGDALAKEFLRQREEMDRLP